MCCRLVMCLTEWKLFNGVFVFFASLCLFMPANLCQTVFECNINLKNRKAYSFPAVCCYYYLSVAVNCFRIATCIYLKNYFFAVSQSQWPCTDYRVEAVVCIESQRGVASCLLRASPSMSVFGLARYQDTRVWCVPLVLGFPLKLAGLLFSLGGSFLTFSVFLVLLVIIDFCVFFFSRIIRSIQFGHT